MNTVIAVIATDAPLDKAAAKRMAMIAHDGLARAIDPIHTLVDGDSIFALSTQARPRDRGCQRHRSGRARAPARRRSSRPAPTPLTRAIVHGVLNAETVDTPAGTILSYRDAYPSAFRTD